MRQPHWCRLARTLTVFVVTGWSSPWRSSHHRLGKHRSALLGPTALVPLHSVRAAGFPFAPLGAWSQQTGLEAPRARALAGRRSPGQLARSIYLYLAVASMSGTPGTSPPSKCSV